LECAADANTYLYTNAHSGDTNAHSGDADAHSGDACAADINTYTSAIAAASTIGNTAPDRSRFATTAMIPMCYQTCTKLMLQM
jgi:hypothetical protein